MKVKCITKVYCYLTIGKIYQAISIDEDGWLIKDDSGDYNIYSSAYLNEV